jgi:hypothetical protein
MKYCPRSQKRTLAQLPLPPTFVPPGCNRVPTPPLVKPDINETENGNGGDVHFAKFVFDLEGEIDRPKMSPTKATPVGVWDSDAILMSQENITPSGSSEEGSPAHSTIHVYTPAPMIPEEETDLVFSYMVTGPGSGAITSQIQLPPDTQSPMLSPPISRPMSTYFRVRVPSDSPSEQSSFDAAEAAERAKFDWLVPEHLPNSPLCPLHPKYRGVSKGMCFHHGRAKKKRRSLARNVSSASESRGSSGGPATPSEFGTTKKRRLVSLSSP